MSEIQHLSYSSISMYLECAEAWNRKYVKKEPTFSNSNLVLGSAFHKTIETAIQLQSTNFQGIWSEQFGIASLEENIMWGDETPESVFNEGVRLFASQDIQEAVLSIHPQHDERGAIIERKVELRVPGVPVPVIGFVDIVLDDGTPADFKTSSKSWSDSQAAGSLQTLFYIAAMNQMGTPVNWKFKHFIFVKNKTPKVQVLEHSHKPSELFFLFEVIANAWRGIEREVYPLNPNSWKCGPVYCDFFANCRGKYG